MYKFTNPHPEGKRVGDCIKRACVIASSIDYHSVQIMLNRWKKINGEKRYWESFIEKVLMGLKISKDMRYIDNGHRYTVNDFADAHYESTHILRCAGHLVCSKDGNYYDTWNSGYKSVYIAWLIPDHNIIINHIKKNHKELCKGLEL